MKIYYLLLLSNVSLNIQVKKQDFSLENDSANETVKVDLHVSTGLSQMILVWDLETDWIHASICGSHFEAEVTAKRVSQPEVFSEIFCPNCKAAQ